MQNLVVLVIELCVVAWLAHVTIEAVREHRRSSEEEGRYRRRAG